MEMTMLEKYKMMASLMEGDYESVRNGLFIKAVNADRNAEILKKAPHTRIGDIALTYWVEISQGRDYVESAIIRVDKFPKLGLEQLHRDALANSVRLFPPVLMPMWDMYMKVKDSMKEFPEESLEFIDGISMEEMEEFWRGESRSFILTNQAGLNGASCLWYPGMMEEIYQKIGGEYFILPSSTHELILLPKDERRAGTLHEMIHTVNIQAVAPEEILSWELWVYDSQEKTVKMVEM